MSLQQERLCPNRANSRRVTRHRAPFGREIESPKRGLPWVSSFARWTGRAYVFLTLALLMLAASRAAAQGVLTNGLAQDGAISAPAETGTWTIAATRGDRVVVQIAKLTGGA